MGSGTGLVVLLTVACSGRDGRANGGGPAADDTADAGGSDTGPVELDEDGDGQYSTEGDCDEGDPRVYRGAPDEDGDGVDSNCDGIDSSRAVVGEAVDSTHLMGDDDPSPDSWGNTADISVAMLGDADGDGLPDIAVGGPTYWYQAGEGPGRSDAKVWLVSGLVSGDGQLGNLARASSQSPNHGDYFGDIVTAAGDVDGDGLDDVLAAADQASWGEGAWGEGPMIGHAGVVAAYPALAASTAWSDDCVFAVHGAYSNSWLRMDVVDEVDTDADGQPDLATTSCIDAGCPDGESGATSLYLAPWIGGLSATDADVILSAGVRRVSRASLDLDADGYDDLLLISQDGRLGMGVGPFENGEGANLAFSIATPDAGNGSFSMGDVDGDGSTDLAFGCAACDSAGDNSGQVAFFLGPLEGTCDFGEADFTLDAEHDQVGLACGLSIAGDRDGDGDDEIVVAAPGVYANQLGAVTIFADAWTGTKTTADAELVLDGAALFGCFGWSLAAERDLDGDSKDDLAVGEPYDGDWAGSLWIFPGAGLDALLPWQPPITDTGGRAVPTAVAAAAT